MNRATDDKDYNYFMTCGAITPRNYFYYLINELLLVNHWSADNK